MILFLSVYTHIFTCTKEYIFVTIDICNHSNKPSAYSKNSIVGCLLHVNPFTPIAAKNGQTPLVIYFSQKQIEKIFEGEIFIRTLATTLLEIFVKSSLKLFFKVL